MVRAAGVVAAGRVDRVVLQHPVHRPRIVHRDFEAAHVDDVLLGVAPELAGGGQRAVRQEVAEPLAVGDHARSAVFRSAPSPHSSARPPVSSLVRMPRW